MPRLKIEVACEGFFSIPLKKVEIVSDRESGTGRAYFLHQGHIVAVAMERGQEQRQ